jgi:integrase
MGKSAAKSIEHGLETWRNLAAVNGLVVPENVQDSDVWGCGLGAKLGGTVPGLLLCENRAYLDGNLGRKKLRTARSDYVIWDTELTGFGLRVQPTGTKSWIVRLRRRGKQQRVTLGRTEDIDAVTARWKARQLLTEVALDGLPRRDVQKQAPLFSQYVDEFWRDCGHHWKPSTQKRNRNVIRLDLLPHFSTMRLDTIGRPDIIRWRDDCVGGKEAKFNRALPVLAAMFKYAELLGYIRKGSNPCRRMPRFKRKAMERFLSPAEYRRLGTCLAEAETQYPAQVAIVRLLLYTGARHMEIGGLEWDWIQPPRLLLPDSKTGAKTIWLCSEAVAIIEAIPHRDGTPLVFPNRKGTAPVMLDNWWIKFRRYCALPDVRIHDLRHSYASIAIREKVALATIGSLLGHELPETTAKYAHLADDTIAEAASRVSGGLAHAIGLGA